MVTQSRRQAGAFSGSADEVEAAFYEALRASDLDRMMACWADEDDIVCVHPGGGRLMGAGAIRSAFEALFANGSVRVQPERVFRVDSLSAAVHSVLERIEVNTSEGPRSAYVVATNVYHRTPQGWRLVAHHASPGTLEPPADLPGHDAVLH